MSNNVFGSLGEVDKNKFPGCEESLMEFKNRVIDMY